jgi:hypothetical protein
MQSSQPRVPRRPRRRHRSAERTLKDRLIQTRVPEDLESALKDAARQRRLSVSQLLRTMLEDTFHLVDDVISEVDHLVQDSVGLARQVREDAARIAEPARREPPARSPAEDPRPAPARSPAEAPRPAPAPAAPAPAAAALDHVLAWNKVVLNRDAACATCGKALQKGGAAQLGLSQQPGSPPVWLCSACSEKMTL